MSDDNIIGSYIDGTRGKHGSNAMEIAIVNDCGHGCRFYFTPMAQWWFTETIKMNPYFKREHKRQTDFNAVFDRDVTLLDPAWFKELINAVQDNVLGGIGGGADMGVRSEMHHFRATLDTLSERQINGLLGFLLKFNDILIFWGTPVKHAQKKRTRKK